MNKPISSTFHGDGSVTFRGKRGDVIELSFEEIELLHRIAGRYAASIEAPEPAELRALVETAENGGKVIWLSEGFPVDRSRYGRIALERRQRGEP